LELDVLRRVRIVRRLERWRRRAVLAL